MIRLITVFILSILIVVVKAQETKGLYFKNISGTKWSSEITLTDSSLFISKHIGLRLIKNDSDSVLNQSCIWTFDSKNIFITLKGDTVIKLGYTINKEKRGITIINKTDSLNFTYTPVATGNYVGLHLKKLVEIAGEARTQRMGL